MGSYELGVWKYLRENDIKYDIVVGTSIGSLNGALMTYDAYDEAVSLWENVNVNKVIRGGVNLPSDFLRNDTFRKENYRKLVDLGKIYFKNKGVDITPFKEWVKTAIDPEKVKNSEITLGIVTTKYAGTKEIDLVAQDLPVEKIIPFLHASSSCWPIFPMEKIDGVLYIDGGWTNNLAIDFALRLGADEVIAVMLPAFPRIPQKFEYTWLPNVKTIIPTRPLGTMMNFDNKVVNNNFKLGYLDACKAYGKLDGVKFTFEKDEKTEIYASKFISILSKKYFESFEGIAKKFTSLHGHYIPKSNKDFYLSTLEYIGDNFSHDYYNIHKLDEFIEIILKGIKSLKANKKVASKYKTLMLTAPVSESDKKAMIYRLYKDYIDAKTYAKLGLIMKNNPVAGAVLSLLEVFDQEGKLS